MALVDCELAAVAVSDGFTLAVDHVAQPPNEVADKMIKRILVVRLNICIVRFIEIFQIQAAWNNYSHAISL